MQAGQETTRQLPFSRTLVHGQTDCFFDNFGVVLPTSQLDQSANHLVRIAGIKILLDTVRQLQLELTQGENGAVNGLFRPGIVSALVRIRVSAGAAEHVLTQILRFVVQRILLVNGDLDRVRGIHFFLPLPLPVAALFFEGAVEIARIFVGRLFPRNVALGGPFFHFGFVQCGSCGCGSSSLAGQRCPGRRFRCSRR